VEVGAVEGLEVGFGEGLDVVDVVGDCGFLLVITKSCESDKCKLTKIKVKSLRSDVMPQPATLLAQVLELLHTLVNESDLVLLEVSLGHFLKLFVKFDQEVVDAGLEESAVLLTLDQDAEALHGVHHHHAAAYDIAKLLLGAKSIEAGFVKHLRHQQKTSTQRTILVLANHDDVLDAVVDVVWVLERVFPSVVATWREQHATLRRPLAGW
jgi:hypothetical protein